jgi:hypothetical protein
MFAIARPTSDDPSRSFVPDVTRSSTKGGPMSSLVVCREKPNESLGGGTGRGLRYGIAWFGLLADPAGGVAASWALQEFRVYHRVGLESKRLVAGFDFLHQTRARESGRQATIDLGSFKLRSQAHFQSETATTTILEPGRIEDRDLGRASAPRPAQGSDRSGDRGQQGGREPARHG